MLFVLLFLLKLNQTNSRHKSPFNILYTYAYGNGLNKWQTILKKLTIKFKLSIFR